MSAQDDLIHPLIFRAMVEGQIGEGCPFKTIKAAADHYDLTPEVLRLFVRGKRPAEPAIMKAFGVERVVFYRPVNKNACNQENENV